MTAKTTDTYHRPIQWLTFFWTQLNQSDDNLYDLLPSESNAASYNTSYDMTRHMTAAITGIMNRRAAISSKRITGPAARRARLTMRRGL